MKTPQPHASSVTSRREQLTRFLANRARSGAARSRAAILPAITSALAAVGAYIFANLVLGHSQPLFAATSALVSLGFGRDPRIRKVLEIAIGCTLGILLGDTIMHFLGAGYAQALLVVFVSILVARFLDSGVIFTTQMSLQSVLVVLLPIPAEGTFSRSLDAIAGGAFALVITMLMPKNLKSDTVDSVRAMFTTTTSVLRDCGRALQEQDTRMAWMALVAARSTQSLINDLEGVIKQSRDLATYSPTARDARKMLDEIESKLEPLDLAVRSLRIVVRRVITVIDQHELSEDGMHILGEWFDEAADAVAILGRSLAEPKVPGLHRSLSVARDALGAATTRLTPDQLGANTLQSEALVMLCRPMMVDFIEVTGASHREAQAYLPELR